MIFVWRGWGPLALAVLILPVASCAGLIDYSPVVANALFGMFLLMGGVTCVHLGRKWNRGSGYHSMYWLPLESWGWVYVFIGVCLVLILVAGVAWRLINGRGLS